ncbi:LysR family transcriptional regulator, partial [Thioclava sp. BHET1]
SHVIAEADLRDRLELGSNEAVRTAVRAGGGATILSHLVVDASLIAGELVRVDFPAHPRRFRILRHPERYETEAVRAFLSLALSAAP